MLKYICPFILLLGLLSCKEKNTKPDDTIKLESRNTDYEGLYQYYNAEPKTLQEKEENKIIDFIGDNNMDAVRTTRAVYIANHLVGKGDSVKWGDKIKVHYRGYFLNGNEFDSSIKRGEPIEFVVGTMVRGWNEALPYLMVGSKATFILPSHMGYGEKGFPGFVAPNEIILFDIEILEKVNQTK